MILISPGSVPVSGRNLYWCCCSIGDELNWWHTYSKNKYLPVFAADVIWKQIHEFGKAKNKQNIFVALLMKKQVIFGCMYIMLLENGKHTCNYK